MIGHIGFQPRDCRRPGPGLPHLVIGGVTGCCRHQTRRIGDLARIEIRPTPIGRPQWDRMGGEYKSSVFTQWLRQCCGRLGDSVGEHLHQKWMVEVLPQFHQFRRTVYRLAGPGDVLLVLRAPRVATPGRGAEYRCAGDAVRFHRRDGVFDERIPVAVAEVHRQRLAAFSEFGPDLLDQRAVDPVDGRHPTEVQIVLGDGHQPLRRYAPAARHVLQERHDLLGALGPAEGQQQQGVKRLGHSSWVLAPPSA